MSMDEGVANAGDAVTETEVLEKPFLNQEYQNDGWSVEFSRSQNKYYFFHRISGTSCWTFDDLTIRGDEVARDRECRVARQKSSGETPSSTGTTPSPMYPSGSRSEHFTHSSSGELEVSAYPSGSQSERQKTQDNRHRKRRVSAEVCESKMPRLDVDETIRWSFNVESECFAEVRHSHYSYFGPSPRMEHYRSLFFGDLRKSLMQGIKKEFGIDLHQSSFNRWITEARAFDTGFDPLLPTSVKDLSKISSLRREILYEIPTRVRRPTSLPEANRMIGDFAREAERCLRRWCEEGMVNAMMEEIGLILRPLFSGDKKPSMTQLMDVLYLLINKVKPTIDKAANGIIDGICSKIFEKSTQRANWIEKDFLAQISNPDFVEALSDAKKSPNPQPVSDCNFLVMPDEPAKILGKEEDFRELSESERAVIIQKGPTVIVKLEDTFHEVRPIYFEKLKSLYRHNTPSDIELKHFPNRLWILLNRYNTYLASDFTDVNQAALPPSVFECLNNEFSVTFELFASPFNCYFKQYCSAFPDTDCFFGSRGPLFNFFISQGSFQANPPFTEELLNKVVDFITNRLQESDASLSIAVFVPDWRDPPIEALQKLENSCFNRAQLTFPARRHGYRQDRPLATDVDNGPTRCGLLPSSRGTTLIFMQNDSGYQKWTPTSARLKKLREAFFSSLS